MREHRPVGAVLIIAVVDRAEIVEPVERGERRDDIGTRRAARARNRRLSDAWNDAERAVRRIETRKAAAGNDAAVGEAAVIVAEAQIVADRQLFVGIEAADEPVERAVERLALQAQFLREGMELAIGVVARRAIEDVDRAIIGVRRLARRSEEHKSEPQSL